MARVATCRWKSCGQDVVVTAGEFPIVCPCCTRPGRWIVEDVEAPEPIVRFTVNDVSFLRSVRISAE